MRYSRKVKPTGYLKAKVILQDVSYKEKQETLALLKILSIGDQDVAAGNLKFVSEVVARLRQVSVR